MKTPVLFVDGIVFPGLPGFVEIEPHIGLQLEDYWHYMGFGTLDVVLAFPLEDGSPASAQNMAPVGSLAEVTLEPTAFGMGLTIHGGHRVKLGPLSSFPADHISGWSGPVVNAEPSVATSSWDQKSLDRIQRRFFGLLLADPEAFDPGEDGLRRTLTDPVAELGGSAGASKVCSMIAEFMLHDNGARRGLLLADDLDAPLAELEAMIEVQLGGIEEVQARHDRHYLSLVDALHGGLRDVVDGLEAARRLGGMGLVSLPKGTSGQLVGLRDEVERAADKLSAALDALSEHLEPASEEEEDG